MHGDRGVGLLAGLPEHVPVAGVERGEAELGRVLAEGDGVAALGGAPPNLGRGRVRVPQRDEGQRHQASLARAAAPLVDHPVVVDLEAGEGELLVFPFGEPLAGEARKGVRVVDPDLLVVGVHVGEAGRLVIGARPEVLVDRRDVLVLLDRHPSRRMQPVRAHDQVVEEPDVGPWPSSTSRSMVSTPPLNVLFVFSRTQRGPRSRMRAGSSRSHRSRGSRMWSSTEMMSGNSSSAGVVDMAAPVLEGPMPSRMGWTRSIHASTPNGARDEGGGLAHRRRPFPEAHRLLPASSTPLTVTDITFYD